MVDLAEASLEYRSSVFDANLITPTAVTTLDPNWFYSTLAQSTAALVGLTGGFLVSRLLDRQRDIEEARPAIVAQYRVVVDSFERQHAHAQNVVSSLEHVSAVIASQEGRGWTSFDPAEGDDARRQRRELRLMSTDDRYWRSPGNTVSKGSPEDVAALRSLIPLATGYRDAVARWGAQEIADALRGRRAVEPPAGAEWLSDEPDCSIPQRDTRSYWGTVRYEAQRVWMQSQWRDQVQQYESVRPAYERFRAQLVPPRIYVLIGIMGGLVFAGVFAPLLFLSARPGAWREVLIGAFGVLASALVGYLLFEVRGLRRAGDLSQPWP